MIHSLRIMYAYIVPFFAHPAFLNFIEGLKMRLNRHTAEHLSPMAWNFINLVSYQTRVSEKIPHLISFNFKPNPDRI